MILSPPSLNPQCSPRMRSPSLLKQEFLNKWMMGLQIYTDSNKNMTIFDRKKAIKLSADIAMASSRNFETRWSRAVIAGAVRDDSSRMIADGLLGRAVCEEVKRSSKITRVLCSRKILKRSRRVCQRLVKKRCGPVARRKLPPASSVAKRLVEKRTKVLRGLVPGGEFMDEISLIEETLDYVSALQAQVDEMRRIATAYVPSS